MRQRKMKFVGKDPKDEIISRFGRHVSSGKAEFFKAVGIDFVFGKREGACIWDAGAGKRLINCHSNGGVFNLGHRHPKIISTLVDALKELDIGNHHLISEQRARLGERLAQLTPEGLTYTVFGVSGGEAIDLAIKLARGYTGRHKIISAIGGYHGHTGLALATGDEQYRALFGPNPAGFMQVPFNNKEALLNAIDENTAAVIFETIPATSGMPLPDSDFYRFVSETCHSRGSLFIVDEVQTGLGRTGKLWGIDNFEVSPDIMVIGKGLSGGIYPMSATCFGKELESFFHNNPFIHISTFGGAEVGCPVALEVLDISSDPAFLENVNSMAEIFRNGFIELKKRHPKILVGLRQLGLMMGIEMVNDMCGPILSKTCYDNGILSVYANNDKRISQLLPPLITDRNLADEILERVDKALEDASLLLNLT
ncbi:MAG: aminotransferase class III-fold pyridoxal phosphate-dependent enzyme [Syntrophales bacterium LBB04]|nr:aminotransferase class III-fold pyridoxal phosphate-dependent enzyme [Syntrophales bacterium LBB04]